MSETKVFGQSKCPHCGVTGPTTVSFVGQHFDNCPSRPKKAQPQRPVDAQKEGLKKMKIDELRGLATRPGIGDETMDALLSLIDAIEILENPDAHQSGAAKAKVRQRSGEKSDCYVAMFKQSDQISQDYWDVTTATKICNPETTMKEIADWFFEHNPKATRIYVEISQAT